MGAAHIGTVIFDVGGVLADVNGVDSMRRLSGIESDDELWRRWLTCRWVRSFEGGACSAEEFARGVVEDWSLPVTPERFLREFRRWVGGPLPGAEDLISDVKSRVPVGCLSNANALHWEDGLSTWPFIRLFDFCFLSFELGLLKPDAEVFEHVCKRLDVEPDRVLFLDDNSINVEAATRVGLVAQVVRGVDEARAALVRTGVLT